MSLAIGLDSPENIAFKFQFRLKYRQLLAILVELHRCQRGGLLLTIGKTIGHYLGDPEFAPIFDELNHRKAVVCIHPNDAPFEPLQKVKAPWATIEFPLETTRTFGYMLWGGTLERCPDIKFIIPHAGGAIPFVIGRYSITKSLEPLLRQYYDISGSANKWALGGLQNFCDPSGRPGKHRR